MIDRLTETDFKAHLNEEFELVLGGGDCLVLTLAETGLLPERPASKRKVGGLEITIRPDPFWLSFRGPVEQELPQGSYTLVHASIGTIPNLFMVPSGEDDDARTYHVTIC